MKKNSKLYMLKREHTFYIILYVSSLLYGISFLHTTAWYVGSLYIPLLSFLWVEMPQAKYKKLHTFLSGLLAILLVTSWMLRVDPGTWAGAAQLKIQPFINVTWVFSSLIWSTGFFLLPYLYKILTVRSKHKLVHYVVFAAAFVLCEWLRSVLFSIANYGSGSSTGPYWSFGTYGLSFTSTPLVYASRIVGLFGLSFLSVLLSMGILLFIAKKISLKAAILLVSLPILVGLAGYYLPNTKDRQDFNVTAVHEPLGSNIFTERVALNSETWQLSEKKQLVVFPEYSGTFDTVITEREKNMLTIIENGQQSMFMDAETFYKDGKHYNRLALLQKDGTVIDGQYKSFLIPAGEYIPSYTSFMLMKFGGGTILNSFQDRVITKSREKIRPFDVYGTEVGALACSGAIAPELYRTLTKQGSELLINSASLGIFRNAPTYYRQNLQLARLEAVANARPFIQVARQGPSFVVDKDGIVIDHKEPRTSTQVTSYTLQKNTHHTPYTILGEWLIVAGFIYTAFMTCWKLQFNQRRIIARLRLLQQFFARHRHQNGS